MRLLSFVPCGCRAGPIDDAPPAAADHAGGDAPIRRRTTTTLRAAAAGGCQWRPSLGDICEEEYSAEAAAKAACRGRVRGAGSSAWDVACRVLPRANTTHAYHLDSASSMRPLAPTAFLF
jgi:hypothetical protein